MRLAQRLCRRESVAVFVAAALVIGTTASGSSSAPSTAVLSGPATERPEPSADEALGAPEPDDERPVDPETGELQGADPNAARGADGTTVDADALGDVDGAADYVAPPPIPNRQRLRPATLPFDLPDPSVIWGGDAFYVFSTNSGPLNVPVVRSRNLADWSDPVDAVPRLPDWARPGVTWAPSVERVGNRWVMTVAARTRDNARHCIGALVADRPVGPYRQAGGPMICPARGAIDPDLVSSPAGNFLYWKQVDTGDRQIFGTRMSADGLRPVGRRAHLLTTTQEWEGYAVENPAMIVVDGQHLLFYSANWWTDRRYAIGYAVCDGPLGPCAKATNARPWISSGDGANGPGGQSFARGPDGQLWMAHHAWGRRIGYGSGGGRRLHMEPVRIGHDGPALVNRPPEGAIEGWVRVAGGVYVSGWVADRDHTHPSRGRVAGSTEVVGWYDHPNGDRRPDLGRRHGFLDRIDLPAGRHDICLEAIDDLRASAPLVGCLEVVLDGKPFGKLDSVRAVAPGKVRVTGWAIDPDTAAPIGVAAAAVGDPASRVTFPAHHAREGLGTAHPSWGDRHAFDHVLEVAPGSRQICVVALDHAGGPEVLLGCPQVTVPGTTTTEPPPTEPTTTTRPTTTSSKPTTTTTRPTTTSSKATTTTSKPTTTTGPTTTASRATSTTKPATTSTAGVPTSSSSRTATSNTSAP